MDLHDAEDETERAHALAVAEARKAKASTPPDQDITSTLTNLGASGTQSQRSSSRPAQGSVQHSQASRTARFLSQPIREAKDLVFLLQNSSETAPTRRTLWDEEEAFVDTANDGTDTEDTRGELFEADTTPSLPELRQSLLSSGLCSHHVTYLCQIYRPMVLHKISLLERNLRSSVDHTLCEQADKCVAFNTSFENYRQSHTSDCRIDDCYKVSVDRKHLAEIINSGAIPLVSIKSGGRLQLQLHRRCFGQDYATVSHVWADGLGNPGGNALPACQIQRLRTIMKHADSFVD